ncbi:eLRR (extracellular Leucine-Rich Repeat) ONly [Caenorhabditis elegans]|uniref:ELRR (Extracellular Leucine-Rich Repeat) ONly n=1 Tax=Caenorhabditis elegans TaxID=6239 RepID=Q9XW74_CAEEL|nr:eLRR (extracellular Leucine-Rich Repeat) ONly [Caenorhabditis elegans]CAA22095.3 eLRR (extracellular Leucine-Rich Repeat) ONly [Caenorhabditis elegans]
MNLFSDVQKFNIFIWKLLILFHFLKYSNALRDTCPMGCQCDEDKQQVTCEGQQVVTLPDRLPSGYESLVIRNSSVRTIEKNSFRKMEKLMQIEFENNPNLGTIEKLAFKGLKKIRLIKFTTCPGLTELQKNAFSGIQNQMGLKIIFEKTPIHRIDGHTFRNAQNIRELTISGEELALSRHCFANINQLDFLTVSGVVLIEPEIFTNSTRFHVVHFKNSQFDIPPSTFSTLSHTSHLLIEHSKVPSIAPDAFSGLTTIQVIELHACQLGTISARAFANVENLGELKILRNTIGDLDTSESIMSRALKTRIEENTLECSCGMKWMTSVEEMSDINFCSTTASFRSIRSFIKAKCLNPSQEISRKTNHLPSISSFSSSSIVNFYFLSLVWYFSVRFFVFRI